MIDREIGSIQYKDFDVELANQRLQELQCRETYRIIGNLYSKEEAEAACQALLEKYPSVYMKVLNDNYIHNLATIEAAADFYKSRERSKYES